MTTLNLNFDLSHSRMSIEDIKSLPDTYKKFRVLGYLKADKMEFLDFEEAKGGLLILPAELKELEVSRLNSENKIALFDIFINVASGPVLFLLLSRMTTFDPKIDLKEKRLRDIASHLHRNISNNYPLKNVTKTCDILVVIESEHISLIPV